MPSVKPLGHVMAIGTRVGMPPADNGTSYERRNQKGYERNQNHGTPILSACASRYVRVLQHGAASTCQAKPSIVAGTARQGPRD